MTFNDIRTTLQALVAVYDNCNSLHTNAFDEAVTTPTEESVRRAMAIQLIINREWGLARNENPSQGSFIIEELTDLVEAGGAEGVRGHQLARRRARRHGNRLPARQDSGGVAALRNARSTTVHCPSSASIRSAIRTAMRCLNMWNWRARPSRRSIRSSTRLRQFQERNRAQAPLWLERLRATVIADRNVFAVLLDAVRYCSLGQITDALYEVGGQYRRNM